MLAALGQVAAGLSLADPLIPVASSVTGRVAEAGQLTDPAYWVRQAREPVRFADCARALARGGRGHVHRAGPGRGAVGAWSRQHAGAGRRRREQPGVGAGAAARPGRGHRAADRRWRGCSSAASRWTGPPVFGPGQPRGWTCRRTRSSGSGTGLARACARAAQPVAGADGAEAGFWAAVDRRTWTRWPARWQVPGDAPLQRGAAGAVALAARGEREQSVLDGWRYRVAWQPVADPEPGTLSGPVAAGGPGRAGRGRAGRVVAPGCWPTAAPRWSPCRLIRPGWTAAGAGGRARPGSGRAG